MRILTQALGLALMIAAIYFLGRNIVFTTYVARYWWRDLSATGSVLSLLGGIAALVWGAQRSGAGVVLCWLWRSIGVPQRGCGVASYQSLDFFLSLHSA